MVDVEDDVTDTSPLTMSSLSTTRTTTTNFSTDDNGDDDVLPEAKVTGLMRDLKKRTQSLKIVYSIESGRRTFQLEHQFKRFSPIHVLVLKRLQLFRLNFSIILSSICNLINTLNCCQVFFGVHSLLCRDKSTTVSLLCLLHPGSGENRLNVTSSIMLLFQMILNGSMQLKILHLWVNFERFCDKFIVTTIFGRLAIWFILVPGNTIHINLVE
jgi:hypothetical protein